MPNPQLQIFVVKLEGKKCNLYPSYVSSILETIEKHEIPATDEQLSKGLVK